MRTFVAGKLFKAMSQKGISLQGTRLLVMGFTFKENCPDIRNTKISDLVRELEEFGAIVDVVDPWVNPAEANQIYGIAVKREVAEVDYDAAVLAVAHREFVAKGGAAIRAHCKDAHILFDLKSCLPRDESDLRL